jgi:hypothetical protein
MFSSYPGLVPFSERSRRGGDIPLSEVTDALGSGTIHRTRRAAARLTLQAQTEVRRSALPVVRLGMAKSLLGVLTVTTGAAVVCRMLF